VVAADMVDEVVDLLFFVVEDIEVGVAIALSTLVVELSGL
jgi:hypothetical protein